MIPYTCKSFSIPLKILQKKSFIQYLELIKKYIFTAKSYDLNSLMLSTKYQFKDAYNYILVNCYSLINNQEIRNVTKGNLIAQTMPIKIINYQTSIL